MRWCSLFLLQVPRIPNHYNYLKREPLTEFGVQAILDFARVHKNLHKHSACLRFCFMELQRFLFLFSICFAISLGLFVRVLGNSLAKTNCSISRNSVGEGEEYVVSASSVVIGSDVYFFGGYTGLAFGSAYDTIQRFNIGRRNYEF